MAASSARLNRLACHPRLHFVALSLVIFMLADANVTWSEEQTSKPANMPSRIGTVLQSDSADDSILESLRRNGLYASAIERCRMAIHSAGQGSMLYARWTSRLVATLAERDSEKAESVSSALTEAKKVHDAVLANDKHPSFRVWNEYAFESVRYQVANRAVANYLAAPTNIARRDDALATIREILDQLQQIGTRVQDQLGKLLRQSDRESTNLTRELASLRNRISLLTIDCLLLRSECYPFGSDDRIAAGSEALTAIEKMAGFVEAEWSGRVTLELARFQSLLAIHRVQDARVGLEKWIPSVVDLAIRNRAIALATKTCQVEGDFAGAKQLLSLTTTDSIRESPEIAMAFLELQIAESQIKREATDPPANPDEANRKIELILNAKDTIAQRFGKYWEQRAEALILSSSYAKDASNKPLSAAPSLDLLKLEIRQRLAAGDIAGAIDRLEQAEAAAFLANDLNQAFSLAKSALGLLIQLKGNDSSTTAEMQNLIERIASTATKYARQPGSSQIHQSAIEYENSLLTADENNAASISGRYKELLNEHLSLWPSEATSVENRDRLQALFLGLGDFQSLIDLWGNEIHSSKDKGESDGTRITQDSNIRFENANGNLVNALLLSDILTENDPKIAVTSQRLEAVASLSNMQRQFYEILSGDFDWWNLDGGISRNDSSGLTLSDESPLWKTDDHQTAILRLLLAARRGSPSTVEPDVQECIRWYQQDRPARLGWMASLLSTLSNIVRVRALSDLETQEQLNWAKVLSKLLEVSRSNLNDSTQSLHPSILKSLTTLNTIIEIRIAGLQKDMPQGNSVLDARKGTNTRSARLTLEQARMYEVEGNTGLETSLKFYRQLAAGSRVGTDVWFEAKLSSVRCLRKMNKPSEANEILAFVQAMVAELPVKWKTRIK